MIKTFNINLAGQIFNINEDAYEHLSGYFSSLRSFYANEEDKDEIIRDIESRFAELFLAKGKNYIVTKADATEVVNMMGNPQEFDEETSEHSSTANQQNTAQQTVTGKRLYRDFDSGLITGVCAGLAAYFGVNDPIWVRLLFIVLTFFGLGSPILVYIILTLIMPKAETSAQKLEMKGEPINLSSIEKKIKDEAENISTITKKNGKGFFYNLLNVFVSIISLFIKILLIFLKFIGIIILSALLLTLFALIIAFVIISVIGAPAASKYFFTNSHDFLWISFGGIIILSTLFIFFAVLLYRRLYNKDRGGYKKIIFPIFGFFMLGILMLNIGANNVRKILAEKKSINQTYPLSYNYKSDTMLISMNPSIKDETFHDVNINGVGDLMDFVSDHENEFIPVEIEIYPSSNDSFYVVREYSANGSSDKDAIQNATSFRHTISQVNNKVIVDPYIQFENENVKFRNQKLKVKVYVPEGKIIRWDTRTERYMNQRKLQNLINWDNLKGLEAISPVPPVPPIPPMPMSGNHKIIIQSDKDGNQDPSKKIVINIDTKNKDINEALDKAQEKLDAARVKLEDEQDKFNDSIDIIFENRLQRQHYIFKMVNGELVPID